MLQYRRLPEQLNPLGEAQRRETEPVVEMVLLQILKQTRGIQKERARVKEQSEWRLKVFFFLFQKLRCKLVFTRTAKVSRMNLQRTEGSFSAVPDFIASHIYKARKKTQNLSDGRHFRIRCES